MQQHQFITTEALRIVTELRTDDSPSDERICRPDVHEAVAEAVAAVLQAGDTSTATVKCLTAIEALMGYVRRLEEER